MRIKVLNQIICNVLFIKEFIRNKVPLLQEPHEDQTGNQTDGTLVVELIVVSVVIKVIGETYNLNGPRIPVAQLLIEFFGKHFDRETAA